MKKTDTAVQTLILPQGDNLPEELFCRGNFRYEAGKLNLAECKMPYLKHQSGDVFFPLFTDVWEYQKYAKNNKALRPIQIPFKDIPKFWVQDAKAYMINPLGFSLPLAKDMIPKILTRFGVGVDNPEQK